MTDFEIINRYRRLAARDAVPELSCPTCNHPVVVRLTPDDEPLLRCYTCGVTTTVGVRMLMEMKHHIGNYERDRT